jgi:hypothetical protein
LSAALYPAAETVEAGKNVIVTNKQSINQSIKQAGRTHVYIREFLSRSFIVIFL